MILSKVYESFSLSINLFKKDKVILMLSLVPIGIGSILYYFLGHWVLVNVLQKINTWIQGLFSGDVGSIIYYIIFFIFSIIFIFLINWTFVLVVAIISSPFNDFISDRVEKKITNKLEGDSIFSLKSLLKNGLKVLLNEVKKVLFIFLISMFVIFIDFLIPFLAPIGLVLSSFLMSSQLLDYSWSRHEYPLKKCLDALKREWLLYSISGFLFMFLFTITILNLIFLPIGVIYYTVLFCKKADLVITS
ncbi:MAG: hypothetical protein CME68_00155 [Halobacteriovoraceae bacterium]|nr:hypothetical protein [Halobacteriovoraceae bacterium]